MSEYRMRGRSALSNSRAVTILVLLTLGLLVSASCGGSGGSSGNNAPGQWNQMNWNQDAWG